MRWPTESAIIRRDDHLMRIRRLTLWIAGGAATASLGLAAAFGHALPGHAATAGHPAAQQGSGSGTGTGTGAGGGGNGGNSNGGGGSQGGTGQVNPPAQPPSSGGGPPVVSSGGS
jgi:hypothetical protein